MSFLISTVKSEIIRASAAKKLFPVTRTFYFSVGSKWIFGRISAKYSFWGYTNWNFDCEFFYNLKIHNFGLSFQAK